MTLDIWNSTFGSACSGNIISKNWVLSSSLIISPSHISDYRIHAGVDFLDYDDSGSFHQVDRIVMFDKNFTGRVRIPQVALIHVMEPFEFDEFRQPIKLFESHEKLTPGKIANISGFGLFRWSTAGPLKMEYAEVPIMDFDECNEFYETIDKQALPEGLVCADYAGNNSSGNAWFSVGGGPLTVDGRLAGLVPSHLKISRNRRDPKLFFEIAYLRNWIEKYVDLL